MIDSNYKDIKNNNNVLFTKTGEEEEETYKMYGIIAGDNFIELDDSGAKTPESIELDRIQYEN